ncbi:lactate utilization protein A [mine drainage metagenome]|uniref:Lactate utilization protein A n=1 Tax=mine drainage metagenome TaxID=410659 RepID=A0A1J5TI49_9ZZZZ
MQTNLIESIRHTADGQEAESILRACVHCGFCTATCPTYQLLGNELDSPRGRIYLIKEMLEGAAVTEKTMLHLDRCLTCRSCETTCPSGVQYGRLVDIGRGYAEEKTGRSMGQRIQRGLLRRVLPRPAVFNSLLAAGRLVRPLLPRSVARSIPVAQKTTARPAARHARTMLVLEGCVQPGLAPNTNAAAACVLDRLGVSLVGAEKAGCCGAVSYHLNAHADGLDYMRRNIDAWYPHVEQGAEAVVMTASGCGAMVKEYGHLLRHDPAYAAKAARISALTRDLSEVLAAEKDGLLNLLTPAQRGKVAFHAPCTLQHGQRIVGVIEQLLTAAGYELTPVADKHLCCGSAGTYSILQQELSQQLLRNKLAALQSGQPVQIASANIGCQTHLQSGTDLPVRHWIELLDEALGTAASARN